MAVMMKQIVELYGLQRDINFVRACYCADDVYRKYPDMFVRPPIILGMLPFEWDMYVERKKRQLKGTTWQFKDTAMTFVNGKLIGGPREFIRWAKDVHCFEEFRPFTLYITLTEEGFKSYMKSKNHEFVYLDITIGGKEAGRIVVELYSDILPKTCANFRDLCTGEQGVSEDTQFMLTYKDSIFHRVAPQGWIQGGDIYYGRGNGGESVYGNVFEDENFILPHDRRGILGMANNGRHSNQSQFYITLEPQPWMNQKYVAFGKIIEGTNPLKQMQEVPTENERPLEEIKIVDCGLVHYYGRFDD